MTFRGIRALANPFFWLLVGAAALFAWGVF